MRLHSKAVAILIMFLFLMLSVVPIINGYYLLDDVESPITSIFYDEYSGMVTLVAILYVPYEGQEIIATYYKIDGGPQIEYSYPFQLPEGTHSIEYWSIDNLVGWEPHKTATLTYDSTPPTVEITSPEVGLYLFGKRILAIGSSTICIGKVPITVIASDETSGVDMVFFNIKNDTGYDSTPPYEYTYKDTNFGALTITVTAVDKNGLMSQPVTMTIKVYSLGIL